MSDFIIVTDSAADLPLDYTQKNNIHVVPFYVSLDGVSYKKEREELSQEELFAAIQGGTIPKTSAPSSNDYEELFKALLTEGKDIICICLSSKLSSSCQNATLAANELNEGGKRIYVCDSYLASGSQGLLINEIVRMREDGLDAKNAFDNAEELKMTGRVYLTLDDLTYLQKGGRIGKVAAIAGTLLNVKPVIVLEDGEIFALSKVRGRKKAAAEVKKLNNEHIEKNGGNFACAVINHKQIGDTDGFGEAITNDMPPYCIGCTIGSHVGTTAAGIACIKKYK